MIISTHAGISGCHQRVRPLFGVFIIYYYVNKPCAVERVLRYRSGGVIADTKAKQG